MIILFTGHRNKIIAPKKLEKIAEMYAEAIWLHGGAVGFDTQVYTFALSHGITQKVIRPDYKTYAGRQAPIIRNKQMVDMCDFVVACYDGRETGGTKMTIDYAKKCGKKVRIIRPEMD